MSGLEAAVMGIAMGAPLEAFIAGITPFEAQPRGVRDGPVRTRGTNDDIGSNPRQTEGEVSNPRRRIEARRRSSGPAEPGPTDAMLEEMLGRTGPFAANLPEIELALSQASFEGLFVINQSGEVIATLRGSLDAIELSEEMIQLMRGNTTIHNHPSISGPSIPDVVGAIARGEREMIVISGPARYRIGIPSGTPAELDALAVQVQSRMLRTMADPSNARFSLDAKIDLAIEDACTRYGITITRELR